MTASSGHGGDHGNGGRRLESWKAIANHLNRTVRTVQRWEREEGLPVRRHLHKKQGTVYAYVAELDAWYAARSAGAPGNVAPRRALLSRPVWGVAAAIVALGFAAFVWLRPASDARDAALPNPEAELALAVGREHLRLRNYDRAIEAIERAIVLDPDYVEPHAVLALARGLQSGDVMNRVAFDEARRAAADALRLDPTVPEAHMALGIVELHSGELARAERPLREAVRLGPGLADAHYWLAMYLWQRAEFADASAELEAALRIEPLHTQANEARAMLYWWRGDEAAARERLIRALEAPVASVRPLMFLTALSASFGRFEESWRWAREAAARYPLYAGIDAMIDAYMQLDMPAEAERWAEVLRRAEGEEPPHLGIWCQYLYMRQRHEECYQLKEEYLLRTGLPVSEQSFPVRYTFGGMAVVTERYDEGIEVLAPLFHSTFRVPAVNREEATPTAPMFAQYLAHAYLATGREAEAAAVLERIERHIAALRGAGVGNWPGLFILEARNEALRGRIDRALAALRTAVEKGWRSYVFEEPHPAWDALRGNPDYEALLARVRDDVAAQRRRIEAELRDTAIEAELLAAVERAIASRWGPREAVLDNARSSDDFSSR